jgi:starvation-inducible DNA-binding protein
MVDTTAERIATLGVPPNGLIGHLGESRTWDDYALGRALSIEHLGALDVVYVGLIEAHREATDAVEDLDLVTHDMLIGQLGDLEQFHWFVRAHLESDGGKLSTTGAHTETEAARSALKASR